MDQVQAAAAAPVNPDTQECYPSLTEFLSNLKLSRYQTAFMSAGVADDDIPQLLRIDEIDLRELLDSVGMLPFHAIAFRSTLRLLRKKPSPLHTPRSDDECPTLNSGKRKSSFDTGLSAVDIDPASAPENIPIPEGFRLKDIPAYLRVDGESKTISKDVIISHATIYGKNSTRALTPYEKAINEACVKLALHNPVLLADKGAMLELAKQKLLQDGYSYKRGQSRSKLNPNARSGDSLRDAFKQRRNQTAEKLSIERKQRLAELEEKLNESMTSRRQAEALVKIRQKEKDVAGLQQARRILDAIVKEKSKLGREISTLKSQERKHQWYEKQKSKKRADSGYGESSFLEDDENKDDEPTASQKSSSSGSDAGSRHEDDGVQSQDSAIADCTCSSQLTNPPNSQSSEPNTNGHSALEALSIAAIAAAAAEQSALGGVETRARKKLRSILDDALADP
ncbi:hypothetical protein Unana1_01013 [Umbelopsis nana]